MKAGYRINSSLIFCKLHYFEVFCYHFSLQNSISSTPENDFVCPIKTFNNINLHAQKNLSSCCFYLHFLVKCARPFVGADIIQFTLVNFVSRLAAAPAPSWIISLARHFSRRALALIIQKCIRFYWAFIDLIRRHTRLSRRATFHFNKMHSAPDLFLTQFFNAPVTFDIYRAHLRLVASWCVGLMRLGVALLTRGIESLIARCNLEISLTTFFSENFWPDFQTKAVRANPSDLICR
jgi:hypothetical protein